MNDFKYVSIAAILPFWRYAVGPASINHPAIPFWSLKSARVLFEEVQRELPWAGSVLYKRKGWSSCIETLEEYVPKEDEPWKLK